MEFSRPKCWVGSPSLLQGIFPTQGTDIGLPHCRWILYQLSHKGRPKILEWVAYPFSNGSSQPRNWTKVSYIASEFFTSWAIREARMMCISPYNFPFPDIIKSASRHSHELWFANSLPNCESWKMLPQTVASVCSWRLWWGRPNRSGLCTGEECPLLTRILSLRTWRTHLVNWVSLQARLGI